MPRTLSGANVSNGGTTFSIEGFIMLTTEDKNRLRTIISNVVGGNRRWLMERNIWIGENPKDVTSRMLAV